MAKQRIIKFSGSSRVSKQGTIGTSQKIKAGNDKFYGNGIVHNNYHNSIPLSTIDRNSFWVYPCKDTYSKREVDILIKKATEAMCSKLIKKIKAEILDDPKSLKRLKRASRKK